jgi:hypothetical protein
MCAPPFSMTSESGPNKTFNYIAPSVALAREYLATHERVAWIAEIERMIGAHHKIMPSHANHDSLVEPFR